MECYYRISLTSSLPCPHILEFHEVLDVHDEADGAADLNFDRARQAETHRSGVRGQDIDELLAGFATLSYELEHFLNALVVYPDEQSHISFTQEAAGAAYFRELMSVAKQGFSDAIFVAIMYDCDDEFHVSIPPRRILSPLKPQRFANFEYNFLMQGIHASSSI